MINIVLFVDKMGFRLVSIICGELFGVMKLIVFNGMIILWWVNLVVMSVVVCWVCKYGLINILVGGWGRSIDIIDFVCVFFNGFSGCFWLVFVWLIVLSWCIIYNSILVIVFCILGLFVERIWFYVGLYWDVLYDLYKVMIEMKFEFL